MNDCPNADIRDQLPDLIHERLDVSMRAAVVAHVADCVDCREELELLRGVRSVLVTPTPRIDITRVVAALPKPSQRPAVAPAAAHRTRRMDWRIAAAVTFLAVGGSSVALLNRTANVPPAGDGVPSVAPQIAPSLGTDGTRAASPVTGASTSTAPSQTAPSQTAPSQTAPVATAPEVSRPSAAPVEEQAAADVSPGGRLADLNENQLKALLGEIGRLPAVPVTEPEPVSIHVGAKTSGAADDAR